MAKIQNTDKPRASEDVEQGELSFMAGGTQHGRDFGRQCGSFLQN